MHHWEFEYFDENYDEKQKLLRQTAKEEYLDKIQEFKKVLEEYERYETYKRNAEPGEHYPDFAA